MGFSIQQILEHCKAKLLNDNLVNDDIEHFVYDTRNLYFVEHCIFISFIGKHTDGHQFIEEAYQKGIRHFIVSRNIDLYSFPGANFLRVENTIEALHRLSIWHRSRFDYLVVGITGSTGKTSLKEWLYQLLTPSFRIVKTPRSYNSEIGVPLSILKMRIDHELGLFEAGPAAPSDMDPLVKMIQPNIGIFTNIGDAHNDNFRSKEEKILEKLKLFRKVETLIYCVDYELIHKEVKRLGLATYSWSMNQDHDANVNLLDKRLSEGGYVLTIAFAAPSHISGNAKDKTPTSSTFELYLPHRGSAAIENVMHCVTVMLYLGLTTDTIKSRVSMLSSLSKRMEMKIGANNCTILEDNFSADMDSFMIAMDYLERQSIHEAKTLVISEFASLVGIDLDGYPKLADYINGSTVGRVVVIGESAGRLKTLLNEDIHVIPYGSTDELIKDLGSGITFLNETILVKGDKSFKLGDFTKKLYDRSHNTVLEVNMFGLAKNLKVYSELLAPKTKMVVMVKASAYGAGSVEVAKMLEYNNVDYFAVAYADEGVLLRQKGITTPIMVLNPEIPEFDHFIKYNLEPEIYSIDSLNVLVDFINDSGHSMNIHIKIESGMNRLGFVEEDLELLIHTLKENDRLNPISIFSHLSSSGEADKDEFSHAQVKRYLKSYDKIVEGIGIRPLRHILNSAGIIRFPEYHFDMVRLGAGLYGIDSYLPFQEKITTVLSFKSRVSQVKLIAKGESVGYSRGFVAPTAMKIAIVSAGYADGIPRVVSYGKYALLINGQKANIIGVVAMDMCMVDISNIEDVIAGDEVVIFGRDYPVEGLAKAAGTISYEIFTSIAGRVKRVYYY